MRLSPHPFTLRQLQYIVAVAERRSFRKAAQACAVSQPSLSAQVAQFEELLGVKLFERDPHRVLLTPAGEAVVAQARQVLAAADELVAAGQRVVDPLAGTLRLGIIPTLGPYLLPELTPALRAGFPRLTALWLEERTAQLMQKLSAGELDAAIVALEAELGEVERLELGVDPFLLASPPGHALSKSGAPVRADELEGEPMLLLDEGHCLRQQALALCAQVGATETGFRATSLPTLAQMVAGGAGLTLLPQVAASVEGKRAGLHLRPFEPEAPHRTIALVWRPGSPLQAALGELGQLIRKATRAK